MIRIECPWCGPRSEEEFTYGGPSHIVRPENPDEASDDDVTKTGRHSPRAECLFRVPEEAAREAFRKAHHKLPIDTRVIARDEVYQ